MNIEELKSIQRVWVPIEEKLGLLKILEPNKNVY